MTFTFLLKSLGACSEAVAWRDKRDLKTTWAECERGDWMLWLCGRMAGKKGWPSREKGVFAACDCAELSLPIFEKRYPDDKRPRIAIETARKWANGKATLGEVWSAAANAASAAANAASDADAADAYAAYAAYAASATANVAYAYADAASAAADAYASDADAAETLRKCADICRDKLKVPEMKA